MQEMNESTPLESPTSPSRKREMLSTIGIIIAGFTVAILIAMFVFRSYQVDGPSMQPSLQDGDRLIIWKLPHTIGRLTGNEYVPNRGDIIVLTEQTLINSDGSARQIIKRVIALPGERVVIKDGTVTVYNDQYTNGFMPDTTLPYGEGKNLTVTSAEQQDVLLGKNQVFVLGDNRDNSSDSRMLGPIDTKNIVGKLVIRVYPLGNTEIF